MSVWKRNAVVVAIVLFVGAAVYLNWSYSKEAADGGKDGEGGKLLGQTTLVNGENDGKGASQWAAERFLQRAKTTARTGTPRPARVPARPPAGSRGARCPRATSPRRG